MRIESDRIGSVELLDDTLYGIHTQRALDNFPLSSHTVARELVSAFGMVKLACIQTARSIGVWKTDQQKAMAIEHACQEMADGLLSDHIVIDSLAGGAGTSLNMNVNEVIANRALVILGFRPGMYEKISPLEDVNIFQSTNDTFPTALKLSCILLVKKLEAHLIELQSAFESKEKEFASIVKIGRTEMQDAVLTTLGREMGAYAAAFSRDRWRVYKCEERLRTVNLGGTAIGTGITAPREYIFTVVDTLRKLTNIGFARAENLIDATQNVDVFVEVSGILNAVASNIMKCCSDLRFLSSGPDAGIHEIILPVRQTGSSLMPAKVNPVIPEAAMQAAMMAFGYHLTLTTACGSGSLELNPFLPLIADCLIQEIRLLSNACKIVNENCVLGIQADVRRCKESVANATSTVTALVGVIGYKAATDVADLAIRTGKSVKEIVLSQQLMDIHTYEYLISPEAVCKLGSTPMNR